MGLSSLSSFGGCIILIQSVLFASSICNHLRVVFAFRTFVDGRQKNSPCRGAGAVNMMQAMNQADGILHRKISRTVRNCHLPNSPFTLPITSIFSISTWASSGASFSVALSDCAGCAYALSSHGVDVNDDWHCNGLPQLAHERLDVFGSRRREASNGISAYRWYVSSNFGFWFLVFVDSRRIENWLSPLSFVRYIQHKTRKTLCSKRTTPAWRTPGKALLSNGIFSI